MTVEQRLEKIERDIQDQGRLINELMWSSIYHDASRGCKWFPPEGIPCWPGRGAVGYQYMYVTFRILNELAPKSILEIGMGQSTRLIGQYIKTRESIGGYHHYCVEHDGEWARICDESWPLYHTGSEIVVLPLEVMNFVDENGNKRDTCVYKGFYDKFKDKKFDLISVDGPYGFNDPLYSRIDILEIIPQCLCEDFCILVDDYNRPGEKRTVAALLIKLEEWGIPCEHAVYNGEKELCIITSKSWEFLCSM